jgi:hypothetical protein
MRKGRFMGLPYDWRPPTMDRVRKEWWDPSNRKVFVPKAYGWGYGINWAAVVRPFRRRR